MSSYTYDTADRLTDIDHVKNGSTTIASVSYTLDAVGNRTQRVDDAGTHTYAYDDLYRLTSVTYPGPSTTTYAYDAFGNRTSMTKPGSQTTTYAYNDGDRITSVTPPSPASSISYTWDDNGNLTNRGSDTFAWDYEDRMTSATVNSVTTTFAYRGDGLRHSKTTGGNTTTFTWDINAGLPVVLDDGNQYLYGSGLEAQKQSGNWYYYLGDGLGSTMAIVNASGTVQNSYTYDAYGEATVSGSLANDFDFAGQQTDASTGLQYLRARYMDPETGTFLSREPLEMMPGWAGNPYGYGGGNPATMFDPTGLWPDWCHLAAVCWRQITPTNVFWIEELFFGDISTERFRVCQFIGEYKDCGTSTYSGTYLLDHLDEIVKPWPTVLSTVINLIDVLKIGRAGTTERTRVIDGDVSALRSLYRKLSAGGTKLNSTYPGEMVVLKNGTRVGWRKTSRSGPPTIDIHIPGQRPIEIKFR